jgi:chromosomal replication initiator protein
LKAKWSRIAQRLRAELGEDLYNSWFTRLEPVGFTNTTVVVSVPTRFLRSWIQSHYFDKLLTLCAAELGNVDNVEIRVRPRGTPIVPLDDKPTRPRPPSGGASGAPVPRAPAPLTDGRAVTEAAGAAKGVALDHKLTFDTFLVGRSNALAHAAAMRVADAPVGSQAGFNPLYVHSASGLGKTHLLNAVAHQLRSGQTPRKVLYLTAERFMYHFKAALDARDTLSFKDHFQGADVLLIDDFQFLQGKTMHQEFYHTFNSLVDVGRQIIIAADLPPGQLENVDARMRSRLAGGLVVDIEAPELDLRRDILRARLADAVRRDPCLVVPDDIVEFIANRVQGGGRELEGALTRVIANQQFTRAPVTVDMAAIAIRDLVNPGSGQRVKIDDILRVVGKHYNVPKSDLLSPRRARSIVRPRQIGMYLAKTLTTRSLPEIGRRFGGRDHSTVLHAVRKIEGLIRTDDKLAREVTLLVRLLEQP